MENIDRGQINTSAAEVYEEFFIPALFQEWPTRMVDAANIQAGQRVLDVACGTGVLARAVTDQVGSEGKVVGVDINAGMLAVAERKAPQVEWRQAPAEALPFDDSSFDAVVSQFGLMFFEDRQAAIREMIRVLKPGGRLAVAVWDTLENTPGYASMVALLSQLFGESVANALRAPYILGDKKQLLGLFDGVGLNELKVQTHQGSARFDSIEKWIHTDIKGWVLADVLSDAQVETLNQHAAKDLAAFVGAEGHVKFAAPAHIVTGIKM